MDFILYNPTMIFVITFCFITVFTLAGTRKSVGKIGEKEFLNISQTQWLRGVAIIWIAYSHYYQYIETSFLCAYIGSFGVGMFFLCSGYGLTVSKIKKKDYHKCFLRDKLLRIYAPFTIAFIVEWLMVLLIPIECNDNIILDFLTLSIPNDITWYLKVQVIMYIVYYVLMLICKENNKLFFGSILALSVVYMLISYFAGIDVYWYQNALWFPIGIFVALYKKDVFDFLQKKFALIFLLFLLVLVSGFALVYFIGVNQLYSIIMVNAMVACILLVCSKVSGNSKLIGFMGRHSIEIYFSHSIVLTFAMNCLQGTWLSVDSLIWAFIFIVASVLFAIPIKFLADKILWIADKFKIINNKRKM